jgi:ketosteroid isomerase-like protein
MSQENVEVVERQFKAWNAGDFDEWAETWTQDVEVFPPEGWPEGGVNQGLDAWRRQAERLRDTWAEARVEIDEIRPIEDDCVLARIRYVTKGAGTGIPFDTPMAAVFFVIDGKIKRGRYFWKTEDALKAAGLSE